MSESRLEEAFEIFDKVGTIPRKNKSLVIRPHKPLASFFFDQASANEFRIIFSILLKIKYIYIHQSTVLMHFCNCPQVAYENPLWGEGYHMRAKCWNAMKEGNA